MALQFAKPRSTISEDAGRLTIVIPAMRRWPILVLLCLALPFVCLFAIVVIRMLILGREPRFVAIGIPAISVLLSYFAWSLAWMLFGREVVRVQNEMLSLKVGVAGLSRHKEFPVRYVSRFRVSPGLFHEFYRINGRDFMNEGAIAFDCGAKTHRFGKSLDETEAAGIVARLEEQTPLWGFAAAENPERTKTRVLAEEISGGVQIEIPPKRVWREVLPLVGWLIGFLAGTFMIGRSILLAQHAFISLAMIVSFSIWAAAGLALGYFLAWNVSGRETVRLSASRLTIHSTVLGINRSSEFDLSRLAGLRLARIQDGSRFFDRNLAAWLPAAGLLVFDYDGKAVRFARLITEAEAHSICEKVEQYL